MSADGQAKVPEPGRKAGEVPVWVWILKVEPTEFLTD